MSKNILHLDASASQESSVSRKASERVVANFPDDATVVRRDLSSSELPLLNADMVGAYFTPTEERSEDQKALLQLSDAYVAELVAADVIVVGTPMYNFSIPAAFKAWIDLVARVGETFAYTSEGPVGLLKNKEVIVAVATGGTPLGSAYDHLTPYLKQIFAFMGIEKAQFLALDQRGGDKDQQIADAIAAMES